MAYNAEAGSSTASHRMRITSGGSIPNYVQFAQSFLLDNPDRPLILHTIPNESDPSGPVAGPSKSTTTLHSCTTTVPKLISVVEQIKRQLLHPQGSKGKKESGKEVKGKVAIRGIWQYTESGLLPAPTREEDDVDPLVRALEGNTRPKMTHRPYLQITLSTKPLDPGESQNVTCQYVLTKRRNRDLPEAGKQAFKKSDGEHEAVDGNDGPKNADGNGTPVGAKHAGTGPPPNRSGKQKGHKRKSSTGQEGPSTNPKRSKKVNGTQNKA